MVSTSGRLNADFIRLVYLHATKETKNYLDAIDPVDAEAGHEYSRSRGRLPVGCWVLYSKQNSVPLISHT